MTLSQKKGLGKLWEMAQTIGAGAGILALQSIISDALVNVGKKTGNQGGISTEADFAAFITQLQSQNNEKLLQIFKTINQDLNDTQKKHFQRLISQLSKIESPAAPDGKKESNLALTFLKNLACLNSEDRMEFYQAVGIIKTTPIPFEKLGKTIIENQKSNFKDLNEFAEKVEKKAKARFQSMLEKRR